MRVISLLLFCIVLLCPRPVLAQGAETPGGGAVDGTLARGDYIPRVDSIPSDWETEFKSDSARRDFKRLREYRAGKQEQLTLARGRLGPLEARRDEIDRRIQDRSALLTDLTGLLRLGSATADSIEVDWRSGDFDAVVGHRTPGWIPVEALRRAQSALTGQDTLDKRELARLDGLHDRLIANIENLENDRRQAEAAIDSALAPEYQNQKFRLWVSAFFSALIAVMIVSFFWTIYKKSGDDIGTLLLSDGGLQFVTIFVLIIAIILFGILSILEGRELAAILSGIAGYILGRGARIKAADQPAGAQQPGGPPPPPPPPPSDAAANTAPPPVNVQKIFPEPAVVAPRAEQEPAAEAPKPAPEKEDPDAPKG